MPYCVRCKAEISEEQYNEFISYNSKSKWRCPNCIRRTKRRNRNGAICVGILFVLIGIFMILDVASIFNNINVLEVLGIICFFFMFIVYIFYDNLENYLKKK